MDNITSSINVGFGNCIFLSRSTKHVESVISDKIFDTKFVVLAHRPKAVKVETIDDLHDKLSLRYDDKDVEGTITWRPSTNGKHYVFSKFE